jgi:hypothetical protein
MCGTVTLAIKNTYLISPCAHSPTPYPLYSFIYFTHHSTIVYYISTNIPHIIPEAKSALATRKYPLLISPYVNLSLSAREKSAIVVCLVYHEPSFEESKCNKCTINHISSHYHFWLSTAQDGITFPHFHVCIEYL